MRFFSRAPRESLRPFVDALWHYDGYASPHLMERILPTGTFELVFNLRDNELRIYSPDGSSCHRFSGAVLAGPHGSFFVTDAAEETCVMGVHFKPGGAFPFLPLPAGRLAGVHLGLEDAWGRGAAELHERLVEAGSPSSRFEVLERALLARLDPSRCGHPAVAPSLDALNRHVMVREVVREAGLSERHFVDVFAASVGLAPKQFSRIRRFQRVVGRITAPETPDWGLLAQHAGYSDQSHLVHDFKEFCGMTPGDYARRLQGLHRQGVKPKWNHIPLDP